MRTGDKGGIVAASKSIIEFNSQKIVLQDIIGASIGARTKAKKGSLAHTKEYQKIDKQFTNVLRNNRSKTMLSENEIFEQFTNHAEQDNLGQIATLLDNKLGSQNRRKMKGSIYMHVEKEVCGNCLMGFKKSDSKYLGPFYLFSEEFPNITIYVSNSNNTKGYLTIQNGEIL